MRLESDVPLEPLPGALAVWEERVITGRAQVGDDKMRRELGKGCTDGDVRCPFGCDAAFTWWHVQFNCQECGLRARRETWARCLRSCSALGDDHSQWVQVLRAVDEGVTTEPSQATRRAVARSWDPPKDPKSGREERMRKAGRTALSVACRAGLELQVYSEVASDYFSRRLRRRLGETARKQKIVWAWRGVVARRGPRRASELALLQVAAIELRLMPIGQAVLAEREQLRQQARGQATCSAVAALEWLMVWTLRRWLVLTRRRAAVISAVPQVLEELCGGDGGGLTQWQGGGAGGGRRCVRGVWERFNGVGRARRAFWLAGAYHEAAAGARAWQRRQDARMMESLRQGQEHELPLAGLQRWVHGMSNRDARAQPGLRALRGQMANELIRQGARSDGRGRHAVDSVLEWGWGGANGRTRMAKVSWRGFDLEGTGARWEPTWMPRTSLTPDLQAMDPRVAALAERREREAVACVPDPLRRRTPRIAGALPAAGLETTRGRKRGSKEAASAASKRVRGEQLAVVNQRGRTRGQKRAAGVSAEECEDQPRGSGEAPRQLRKRRDVPAEQGLER